MTYSFHTQTQQNELGKYSSKPKNNNNMMASFLIFLVILSAGARRKILWKKFSFFNPFFQLFCFIFPLLFASQTSSEKLIFFCNSSVWQIFTFCPWIIHLPLKRDNFKSLFTALTIPWLVVNKDVTEIRRKVFARRIITPTVISPFAFD